VPRKQKPERPQNDRPGPDRTSSNRPRPDEDARDAEVRIIGGEFRGRRLQYLHDPGVRPMKHRTRESIFNLVSTECEGNHAIDLFAGSGALGLEALSRGAVTATLIEKHVPTARIVRENIRALNVENRTTLLMTSAFLWAKRDLGEMSAAADRPWLVFCSPPYAFYLERKAEMLELIQRVQNAAPAESILVVESDETFDFADLRDDPLINVENWDMRFYAPATVGIWRSG
jgi:16S rRNA (guanine966-N2)-methyltransferase